VENDHSLAGQAKNEADSAKKTLSHEHSNREQAVKQEGRRGQSLLGRAWARFQAIGTPRGTPSMPACDTLTQAPPPANEISEDAHTGSPACR